MHACAAKSKGDAALKHARKQRVLQAVAVYLQWLTGNFQPKFLEQKKNRCHTDRRLAQIPRMGYILCTVTLPSTKQIEELTYRRFCSHTTAATETNRRIARYHR